MKLTLSNISKNILLFYLSLVCFFRLCLVLESIKKKKIVWKICFLIFDFIIKHIKENKI